MKISIIIVSWNVRQDLVGCIESIKKNPFSGEFEIIVVDNNSSDDSVEVVGRSFPDVVLIGNEINSGFAVANNQGIAIAKGQYILLLNPDTIVHQSSINKLIEFMDNNPDIGVCGPKLLNDDGTTQRCVRRFPTFGAALHRQTIFKTTSIFKRCQRKYNMRDFDHNSQRDVEQIMGAAFLVRKSVVDKIGGLDESYFMYYEEVDFCRRVGQAGWRVVFTPITTITHLGGQSSSQVPVGKRMMQMVSMFKYFRKHRGVGVTAMFNLLFKPAVLLGDINNVVYNSILYLLAAITGNEAKKAKSILRIKNSAIWLGKYTFRLLKA
jgi:GT2 family glycosyltransferase